MTVQHQSLAAGRWSTIPFCEQMAHIGSEVERALSWKERSNQIYSEKAYFRALELIDLTLGDTQNIYRLREISRVRECLDDTFDGVNEYGSTSALWRGYFNAFAFAARRNR